MAVRYRLKYTQRIFVTSKSTNDVVRLTTLGNDRLWKERIIQCLSTPARVLDLACGTGILTFAIAERHPKCALIGVDLTAAYLDIAKQRATAIGRSDVQFVHSAAEDFRQVEPCDAIVSSYLAKYADLDVLTANAASMLKPGGLLLMHEFTYPTNPLIALVWELYFPMLQLMPCRQLRQWRAAFRGLPKLVRDTTWVADLLNAMQQNGFTDIRTESLSMGTAAIVTGRRSPEF
ncbi:MAG TPA: methyltransferase domain-containing protein [Nitrospirales bacterium]|nr:methyltransferase domain-containing protein [Nitrospirales bacterium]